jgi:hypothetical protein
MMPVSSTRSPFLTPYLCSARIKHPTQQTSHCNLTASYSKITKDQFKVISRDALHPDLQSPAMHIMGQNLGRSLGSIIYPLLSLSYDHRHMYLFTPFCVGTHHASIRFAYKAALETLKSGDIAGNPELNDEIKLKLADKSFSRFHFNWKGDLVLHMKKHNSFSLSNFKGITLLEEKEKNPLLCKVYKAMNRTFPNIKPQVSYFHLEQDVQEQMDKVLHARQLRFRACMVTFIVASSLGSITKLDRMIDYMDTLELIQYLFSSTLIGGSSLALIPFCLIGLMIHENSASSFRVEKHANDLWNLIYQKNEFLDIVKPKYRKLYQPNDFNKDLHLHVSTFGNIKYSPEEDEFTFREQHLLKSKSPSNNHE